MHTERRNYKRGEKKVAIMTVLADGGGGREPFPPTAINELSSSLLIIAPSWCEKPYSSKHKVTNSHKFLRFPI
jgi:hypothetical protein